MKRILLFAFVLGFVASSFAQSRVHVPHELRDKAVLRVPATAETMNFQNSGMAVPATANYKFVVEEEAIGDTWYDLQTNSSMQDRIYKYDDGTIGAVFTIGYNFPNFADDRGTGYNYFNGTDWGPFPTERLENDRTGWPAYAPHGENGEIVVAHFSEAATSGLEFSKRAEKGTGMWEQFDYFGPAGHEGLLWPRMTTGGVDHSVIHLLPVTRPVANGGALYEGQDGAILYSRSTDGGATWDPENLLLDDINSDYYIGFSGDTYEIRARGDVVAFLAGEAWTDLVMMKSEDGGTTWEKTVIWENPYPFFDPAAPPSATDTFYCADGAHALSIDQTGMVHVAFGINRAHSDGSGTFWFPLVAGLGYWNETMATFSNDFNSLCPYSDCVYTELVEDESLVAWPQDVDNNGVWEPLAEIGAYFVGASSMPQIVVDDMDRIFLVYSDVTETFDNGVQNYRHLWGRSWEPDEGWGEFVDLTSNIIHIFDECVFPSISQSTDDYLYLVYQVDSEPGLAVRGDEDEFGQNFINFMKVNKEELVGINEYSQELMDYDVSEISPNPVSGSAKINVNLRQATNLTLEVTNMMGQVVMVQEKEALAGMSTFNINSTLLSNGVYFCTVKAGNSKVTKKMIVE